MSDDTNVIPFRPPAVFPLAHLPCRPDLSSLTVSTGWWEFDQLWKLYPGQFTVVTGLAGHGKSTLMLNVLCNLARLLGIASAVYVPENEEHLYAKMGAIWGAAPGFDYFCEEQCFVVSADQAYDESFHDLLWVLAQLTYTVEQYGVKVLLIDPWNELEQSRPKHVQQTDYIRECLMRLKRWARAWGVAVVMIAHPTKAVCENGGRTPNLSDIEGSMSWYNKCDNGLVVVRTPGQDAAKVISSKCRERAAGKLGACCFHVNPDTGVFTPMYGAVT